MVDIRSNFDILPRTGTQLMPLQLSSRVRFLAMVSMSVVGSSTLFGEEAITLDERCAPGAYYRVHTSVDLQGRLSVPLEKDRPPQTMRMFGHSSIDYDERVLTADPKTADAKTIRQYRTINFRRSIGEKIQEISLRPDVRRVVVMKRRHVKVPFSPDGPLTWGEIDMLRTDIFVPAIGGLLPRQAVKPGDTWKVSDDTIAELTDMEKIDRGGISCKFEQVETLGGKKYARILLNGDLLGVNEDGPNRQTLDGSVYFDLDAKRISYLSINGEHFLLDKDGKENGKVTGQFIMTRSAVSNNDMLSDATLAKIALEPNAENTLLLFEEPELGVRLLHPRRWRIGRAKNGQITLDEANGSGLLITVEYPDKVPSAPVYLKEARDVLTNQQSRILSQSPPVRLVDGRKTLDRFSLDVQELNGQQVVMEYLIAQQMNAGATFAARILEKDRSTLTKEVEQMARSLTMTRKFEKR